MKAPQLLLFILLLLVSRQVFAQDIWLRKISVKKGREVILRDTSFATNQDTVLYLTKDLWSGLRLRANPYETSSHFYDTLRKRSSHSKITRALIELVVKKKKRKEKIAGTIIKSEDVFKPYTGYRIRSIVYRSVDLLEGSVVDTLQYATTHIGKFVNHIHRNTRSRIIANNLLFEVGQRIDPYVLADNERILRQLPTLRDARIYVHKVSINSSDVDIVVVTQDVTSLGVSGKYYSPTHYRVDLLDVNVLGYARQIKLSYFKNAASAPAHGYEILVREPNFLGTFMQGELQYTDNYLRQRIRTSMGRDFFTPAIKYAGGIEWYRTREFFYFEEYDTFKLPYTEKAYDLWAGRSIEFKKRYNLILSLRTTSHQFIERPFVQQDSNSFFHNRLFMMGSLSLVKRNYLKSMLIRGFGKTEDIPIGGAISLLLGTELNEFNDRQYIEINGNLGRYLTSFGYLNFKMAMGNFTNAGRSEDGLLTLSTVYFSNLHATRRMKIRQFMQASYTKGYARILDRTLQIDGKWENEDLFVPLGNQRMSLRLETVYFMPWYVYGFQFALFHRIDASVLSDTQLFTKQSTFTAFRIGMRTLNENLVLPLLSVEVGYFVANPKFPAAWELRVSTSLSSLFNTHQTFKPTISSFN